jgi:hypothetical protein
MALRNLPPLPMKDNSKTSPKSRPKPHLSLEDTAKVRVRLGRGQHPYETLHGKKEQPRQRPNDLRELSESIKAERRAARKARAKQWQTEKRSLLLMSWKELVAMLAAAWRKRRSS